MNLKQKEIMIVGSILIILMILFPPWIYFNRDTSGRSSAGYHFISNPPSLKSPQEMFGVSKMRIPNSVYVRFDFDRFVFQMLVAFLTIGGLTLLVSDKRNNLKMILGAILIGCAILGLILDILTFYSK